MKDSVVDFSKAFDLVDHTILIEKLAYFGAEGRTIILLKKLFVQQKTVC